MMELLVYKPGSDEPERREVISVAGTLEVLTVKRDGEHLYHERESIRVSADELARIEIVGYMPPPPREQPPRYREVAVSPRSFFGGGDALSDKPVVTLRVRDDEPEPPVSQTRAGADLQERAPAGRQRPKAR